MLFVICYTLYVKDQPITPFSLTSDLRPPTSDFLLPAVFPYVLCPMPYYLVRNALRLAALFRPSGKYVFAPNLFRLASRAALNLDFLLRSPYFPNRPLRLTGISFAFSQLVDW